MPLYSDMYYNYLNSVPPSVTSSYSSYSSTPSISSNYSSYSTASSSYSLSSPSYSTPSYSSPSYSSPSYSSLPYTPTIRSGVSRFMPKLTTISEAPLSKHRIAALSRMAASHNTTSKYIPPRPRRMDTSDIDVSASRFVNRRISEAKPVVDIPIAEESTPTQKEENNEEPPIARTTIRRDRGLVRLRTVRITPDTKPIEPPKKPKLEQSDIDPGYGSSERSSGSWRKKFENELDLHDKPLSPTSKSLGESFLEKYTIKEPPVPDVKVFLTLDDVPYEQRDFIRRKSATKLPTFKEICSDISSDKLTDDLNAGDLRRRASLIIEEEMHNFTNKESTNLELQKTNEDENANKNKSDVDGDDENETEPKHKNRKIKKKQRATSKTLLSEIAEKVDETKETAMDVKSPNETEIELCTFKVPLRKKKKVTDVKTPTCDLNSTDMSTASHTQTPTELMTLNENENERKIAEIHAIKQKQPESLINIKSKQQQQQKQHSSDLDTKLLIAKNANDAHSSPGEEQVMKNQKSSVNLKTSMKSDVKLPGKMYPLKREPSADDFWGMIGSRETTVFAKRKQQVIEEQQQKIIEVAWTPECDEENEENSSPEKVNNLKLDQKTSESNRLKDTSTSSQSSLLKVTVDTKSYENIVSVGTKKISAVVNENEGKSKLQMENDKKVEPQKKLEAETKLFGNAVKSVAMKTVEKMIEVKSSNVKIEKDIMSLKHKGSMDLKDANKPVESLDSSKKLESEKLLQKKPEVPLKSEKELDKQQQSPKKLESSNQKEAQIKKFDIKLNKKPEVVDKAKSSEESEKESEKKKPEVSGKKMNEKELETKKTEVFNEIELKGKKIEKNLNENVVKIADALKSKEIEQPKMKLGTTQPFNEKLIKTEVEKPVVPPKVDEKPKTPTKIEPKVLETKKSPIKVIQKTKSDGVSKIGTKLTLPEAEKKVELPKAVEIQKVEETLKPNESIQPKPLEPKKSPTKKPEIETLDTKKIEEQITEAKKTAPKTLEKAIETPNAIELIKISDQPNPLEPPKPAVTKKLYGKSASSATDKKTEIKTLGNKNTSDNKSLTSKDGVKSAAAETSNLIVDKKLSPKRDTKSLINQSTSVNDQEKKSQATINDDGIESKKKKQIEEVLNENQTIELNSTTSNNNKISPTSLSKKSFGTLSKFPTLNNLNSIAMNDAVEDNKTTNDNNQSIASEQLNESEQQEKISIALEPSQLTASEQQNQTKEPQESESEEEESSYEEESSEEEEDMGKKDFDPQKKVKIDFTSMQKFFKTDEKINIKLVARPRPLWKIKRNRHAKFSSSESESDDEEVEEICGGDSATGGSQSSTNSEKVVKQVRKNKSSGNEISTENIVALMENLNLNEENEDNDNASEDAGKKKQTRFSTSSHDSGYSSIGATAAKSPRKALETSYTYTQFQKTGKMTAPATVIPRFRKYSVEDFHFLTVLGKGSFGKVFLAELKNTSYYYAVKCLKKDVVLEDDDVECTLIERKVLALGTRHPYLCHLFCTFQTDSHLFFVMEYLTGGDLMFHIQQSGRFTEKRARFYAAEIVSGLKFLHRKGIIYRDLKLDNVLLDHDGHVRLADFGMCKLEIYLDKTADSFCGTPDYMPPEIIKGLHYNQSVDYWSFGVLLYEMLIGQSPFSGCDEDELFWSICNEIPWYPHFLSKESLKILQSLLEKDVSIRLGSMGAPDGDIKYHPFFAEISWEKLDRRELEPPFKPQVRHPLDTQYFDSQFTRERARLTPIDKNILISMDQKQFEGFSYTNPNATLT
ncbi:unnamed protein product [Chironomus riparius]|uniref:Protein kinase C n=1 Tax=Chironomus riparius TaxID=315576 RepID=A0A9N9RPT2_9DIPT|nr:unnamed protein product [Chironomus riparius]